LLSPIAKEIFSNEEKSLFAIMISVILLTTLTFRPVYAKHLVG